jgi:hypothetical protein
MSANGRDVNRDGAQATRSGQIYSKGLHKATAQPYRGLCQSTNSSPIPYASPDLHKLEGYKRGRA